MFEIYTGYFYRNYIIVIFYQLIGEKNALMLLRIQARMRYENGKVINEHFIIHQKIESNCKIIL